MSKMLPLFPLNLVVFPGEQLNLHIFEPRYRELMQDCKLTGKTFGIPPYIDDEIQTYGTEMKLVSIEKVYDDGKLDVKTEGIGIFKTVQFHRTVDQKMYSGADVESVSFTEEDGDILNKKKIFEQIKSLFKFMKIQKSLPEHYEFIRTFKIAQHVGFNTIQKYEMLQISTEMEREEFMLDHLKVLIPMVKEMENLRQRIQMNGHFKNIIPPKF